MRLESFELVEKVNRVVRELDYQIETQKFERRLDSSYRIRGLKRDLIIKKGALIIVKICWELIT